jgi:hypothetical protein
MITNWDVLIKIKKYSKECHHLYVTNQYNSQMNVIIDFFIRYFTGVCNVSVELLQNESSYMIAMVVSYIGLWNDNTEQL